MSKNNAILIENVSKMYKIYNRSADRMLDAFNLGPMLRKNYFQEFWALRDISLSVNKGERLGIIGQNGAGKSTLLRVISKSISPTSGSIRINGEVSALFQVGTCFHMDFSGRENIYSSLAYMGIRGREADENFEEIVDFSELWDFIDQPMKTYSAGMQMRLAFATYTIIQPEILIIDEILSVGDAYFSQKCVERMRKITESGATIIFVSHDMFAVQRLCDRVVWLDKGRIVKEGESLEVIKAYQAFIREKDELRLRARAMKLKNQELTSMDLKDEECILCHFVTAGDTHPDNKHPIHSIKLYCGDHRIDELLIGDAADNDPKRKFCIVTTPGYTDWGKPYKLDGRFVRNFEYTKSMYKHAPFYIYGLFHPENDYIFEFCYKDISKENLDIGVYNGTEYVNIGSLKGDNTLQWRTVRINIPAKIISSIVETKIASKKNRSFGYDTYGSGDVKVSSVQFIDSTGKDRFVFNHGEKMIIRLGYEIINKIAVKNPVFAVTVFRNDGTLVTNIISSLHNESSIKDMGTVDLVLEKLLLGSGNYNLSVAIYPALDLNFTGKQEVYFLQDRRYEFKVEGSFKIEQSIFRHPAMWLWNK